MDVQRILAGVKTIQGALRLIAMLQLTAIRFPQEAIVNDGDTFDYIVVGGGTAGSVVANRLTENPHVTVLLIEAGGDPPLESVLPALYTYLSDSRQDWNYTSPSYGYAKECHQHQAFQMTTGKMLGGSSSMNYMIYLRSAPIVYNQWANITNAHTWRYENVLPYFKKSEHLKDEEILHSHNGRFYGTHGYVGVTKHKREESVPFLEAFEEMGHKIVQDFNEHHNLGYGEAMFIKANGVRQSAAEAFLSPITNRQNLYVLKNALATKILFDSHKNARGVQFINGNNEKLSVYANSEVIVSAGAINSAKLLLLSGIGPRTELNKHRIPVISDLPVGKNLKDDKLIILVHTLDKIKANPLPTNPNEIPIPVINGFVSVENKAYPNYQTITFILNAEMATVTCAFNFALSHDICQKMYEQSKGKQVFLTVFINFDRKSTGEVSLRSVDPRDDPLIILNAFEYSEDVDTNVRYILDFLKVRNSAYFRRNNAELFAPDFVGHLDPGSEEYWRMFVRCMAQSSYHYSGTCAMGSVLDSQLRVLGVKKLRVVDASSMPLPPRANPTATIIMLAEKASDMIKLDNY